MPNESKLFVPLNQAYLVSRYIGAHEEAPTLSQLGSKRWQNTRISAQQQILGYANDLLQLYAERAVQGGFRYPPDSEMIAAVRTRLSLHGNERPAQCDRRHQNGHDVR